MEHLVGARPERQLIALNDAAMGLGIRRATFMRFAQEAGEDVSEQTAGRDLKSLVDDGLLEPRGEKRGRRYLASGKVASVWRAIIEGRDPLETADPFQAVRD
jgi:DNA-binding transcriptional ArsR family regulator